MVKKFLNKVKSVCGRFRQAVLAAVNALVITYITAPIPVFATGNTSAGNTSYLAPINKLKTVGLAVVGSIGGVVMVYGIYKFAQSFQKKDQNGEYQAAETIGAGAIMAGGSIVLGILLG